MTSFSRFLRRSWLVAAALTTGCYSGFSDPGMTGEEASGDAASDAGETGETDALTGGPQTGGASQTATEPTTTPPTTMSPTTDATGDATTGVTDPTTGGDETTGQVTSMDPSTTSMTTMTTMDPTMTTMDPTGTPPDADVPDNAYCLPVAGVDPAWKQLEEDVLALVNQARAQGANCGSEGMFGPAGPLTMEPALRCAARKHSADMDARDFFDHINPDGQTPWDRMDLAGYGSYSNAGENIAAGSPDAAGTMMQWMQSDGHCSNIMNPDFQQIGVGYHPGGQYGHLWTQVFGAK